MINTVYIIVYYLHPTIFLLQWDLLTVQKMMKGKHNKFSDTHVFHLICVGTKEQVENKIKITLNMQ